MQVSAGISGTGGGFKKFCNGETDFNDASRPIKDEEKQACADKGIEWVEFQVGFDGISLCHEPRQRLRSVPDRAGTEEHVGAREQVNNWSRYPPRLADKSLKPLRS